MINNVIKYFDGDPDLILTATVNPEGTAYASPTYSKDIGGSGVVNYATLEADGFLLADNTLVFADENDNIGFLSVAQSNQNAVFGVGAQGLTIRLSEPCTAGGITLLGWQAPLVSFIAYFYDGANVVGYYEITNNNTLDLWLECSAPFTTVQIINLRTVTPYQFIKLRSVFFGKVFEIRKFFEAINCFFEIKPDCTDVPAATCDFEALLDDEFIPQEGQPVEVFHNDELIGRFFVDSVQKVNNRRYVFGCNDAILQLDNLPFAALAQGTHSAADGYEAIEEAAAVNFENFTDTELVGFFDKENCRAALAMLAFAQQKFVSTERSSGIRLIDPPTEIKSAIGSDRIIGKATYTVKAPFTKLGLYVYENSFDGENLKTVLFAANPAPGKAQPNQKSFTQYSLLPPDEGGETFNDFFEKVVENSGYTANEISARIIVDNERVGDLVTVTTEFDGDKTGIIQSMQLDIRGNIVADVVLREVTANA